MANMDGGSAAFIGAEVAAQVFQPLRAGDDKVKKTKPIAGQLFLESAQSAAPPVQSNGRHAVGVQTGNLGRSRIWGQGVIAGDPAQPAPDPSHPDWTTGVFNDPTHLSAEAEALRSAHQAQVQATGKNAHAYVDNTDGHAVQAGTDEAHMLNHRGMAAIAAIKGNGVVGMIGGAISRGLVAPALNRLATTVEHNNSDRPESWSYRLAHNYAIKFDEKSNLERQLFKGLDPTVAASPSVRNRFESKVDFAARLQQEQRLITSGVRPAKDDFVDQVAILHDKAVAREGIDLSDTAEVAISDRKAQFLARYFKAGVGEHGKILEDFVTRVPVNTPGGLTEADTTLLQRMAFAIDKDAQLAARIKSVSAHILMRPITGAIKGGAFVFAVDAANYYADIFGPHEGASMDAHPSIPMLFGSVIPHAIFHSGLVKDIEKDAGFWAKTRNGIKKGSLASVFSIGGAIGLTVFDTTVPSLRPSEFTRIMRPTMGESALQGAAWVVPVAEKKTRWEMAAYSWLLGRSANFNNTEAALSLPIIPASYIALKAFGNKGGALKIALAESAILGVGRVAYALGFSGKDRTATNDESWAAIKKDSEKMTSTSLRGAVKDMTELGKVSPDAVMIYRKQIIDSRDKDNKVVFPISPEDDADPAKIDFGKIISNDRTALILAEAEGQNILDAGLTQAGIKKIYTRYSSHGILDGVFSFAPVIAPGKEADLTGQALKDMLFASNICEITERNSDLARRQQENGHDTMNGYKVTQADIDQMEAEKKKLDTMMRSMLRDGPDAKPHDIKAIVEEQNTTEWLNPFRNTTSYSLSNFAEHDQFSYDHLMVALEDKIQASMPWLENQEKMNLNPELSKKYIGKLFRDAALMRLGWAQYQLNTNGNMTDAKIMLAGSTLPTNDRNAWRNANSMMAMARKYDPDNVDLKELEKERDRIAQKVSQGDTNWYDSLRNPLHIPKPPFVP
jgi:hypothetical protein